MIKVLKKQKLGPYKDEDYEKRTDNIYMKGMNEGNMDQNFIFYLSDEFGLQGKDARMNLEVKWIGVMSAFLQSLGR